MKRIISVPDGFSVDLPDHNLVFNISPFPFIQPIVVSEQPYEVESHLVWVRVTANRCGLFESKLLNVHRCPTCGGEWKHEGE